MCGRCDVNHIALFDGKKFTRKLWKTQGLQILAYSEADGKMSI
jgi:hypothetical protein